MSEHDGLMEGQEELAEGAPVQMDGEVEAVPAEAPEAEAGQAETGSEVQEVLSTVDLNTATAAELSQLPGIGSALAARIVNYRVEVQPFKEPVDVMAVRGVSQAMYERFADRLVASPVEAEEAQEEVPVDAEGVPAPAAEVVDLEEAPVSEPESVEVEPLLAPEAEPMAAEKPRLTDRSAPPIRVITEAQAKWGRLLFVGLVSALLGAVLALAFLYVLNGTLGFQKASTSALRAETYRLTGEIDALSANLTAIEGRLDAMQDLAPLVAEAQADIQQLDGDVTAAKAQTSELADTLADLRQEFTNLREDLDGTSEHVGMLDDRLGEAEGQLTQIDEDLQALRESTGRFDAFLVGLRELLVESSEPVSATPTALQTPTPKPNLTVIPLATPTPQPTP